MILVAGVIRCWKSGTGARSRIILKLDYTVISPGASGKLVNSGDFVRHWLDGPEKVAAWIIAEGGNRNRECISPWSAVPVNVQG